MRWAFVGRRKKWKKESKSEVESFAALGTARGAGGGSGEQGMDWSLEGAPGGRDRMKAPEHQAVAAVAAVAAAMVLHAVSLGGCVGGSAGVVTVVWVTRGVCVGVCGCV